MEVGDVIEIKVAAITPNVADEALNVFFYRVATGIAEMSDIVDAFVLDVLLPYRGIQTQGVQYRSITATNLFNLDEFHIRSYSGSDLEGIINEFTAPPSTAINMTLHRTSRTVRNGAKRLFGFPNVNVQEGVVQGVSFLGDLNEVAVAIGAELDEPISGAVLRPVIVKRIKTANPDYPLKSKYPFKYLLPTEQGQTPVVDVGQVTFSIFSSTQVTRKTNR